MNVIQSQAQQPNDRGGPRSYSAHVNLSKRGQEVAKRVGSVRVTAPEIEANNYTPSAYTVLVSRVENRGAGDAIAAHELADWLGERMNRLSDQSLRNIAALPETAAAGFTGAPNTLAKQIVARLREGSVTQAMLVMLKHPIFAAYMKDQQVRVAMYGPRGMMRAS